MKALRVPWEDFPNVWIHAPEAKVKSHPSYAAAKSGDAEAAVSLVEAMIDPEQVESLRIFLSWAERWRTCAVSWKVTVAGCWRR
jgi:hypothetical protein